MVAYRELGVVNSYTLEATVARDEGKRGARPDHDSECSCGK